MNRMEDVSDEELRTIEGGLTTGNSTEKDFSDEQLISIVKDIKEGKSIQREVVDTPSQTVVEPSMEKTLQSASKPLVNRSDNDSNYWKIGGLPSRCKFYPEGTEILGRPMKVLEVKKISSMNEDNGDFVINDIVRRTIKGIDPNELYTADKLFIIFWLRANTYRDSGYIVPFICPKCEKKSEYHFEVDNLEVQYLSDDFDPEKPLKMRNGDTITYDYLKVKDELFIDRFKELNMEAMGEIDDELLAMAQMIKTVNGQEQTLLQRYYWLIELNPGDYSYLKTYMEKKGMGLKPYVNIECKECGGTAAVAVSFREDFFIPEFKFE